MRITGVETWRITRALKAPFTISFKTDTDATLHVVRLTTDRGVPGLGAAAVNTAVTGETDDACAAALDPATLGWLDGFALDAPAPLARALRVRLPQTPSARSALDAAAHDAWARALGLPLAAALGRAHAVLPTSMTLGIRPLDETLAEARDFLGMGYFVLKVKVGKDVEADIERVARLREVAGPETVLRIDANQGYTRDGLRRFLSATARYGVEFVEQPLPMGAWSELAGLPDETRARLSLDEDVVDTASALPLCAAPRPAAIWNLKLSKTGGVYEALRVAGLAEAAGIALMWGCNIESAIGLSAALHAAFASPSTRYLDLDGDYDLVEDVCTGGYVFDGGRLRTCDAPGLGATLALD